MKIIIAFVLGMLFPYVFQICDLGMNCLVNKQALNTAHVQAEIDILNPQCEVKESAIGFHYEAPEEYYEDEEG